MNDDIYAPKFDIELNERPVILWTSKHGPQVAQNLYSQYHKWKATQLEKNAPPAVFWESGGPAIVRALGYCGAAGLILEHVGHNKVTYRWFVKKPAESLYSSLEYFTLCSVHAEGVSPGSDTRVYVDLPTGEQVTFHFIASEMKKWFKPPTKDTEQ